MVTTQAAVCAAGNLLKAGSGIISHGCARAAHGPCVSSLFLPFSGSTVAEWAPQRRLALSGHLARGGWRIESRVPLLPSFFTTATAASAATAAEGEELKIMEAANMLDIRVGHILKAWRHEEADSLYVEEVDVGEAEPRTICSGLVNYMPVDHLKDKKVIVLANLKPRNMRGVKSFGMLMAASDTSHETVELLEPPESAVPGERVWFGSEVDKENQPAAATPNQIQKKKIWELVQPHLKTDASCRAKLGVHVMQTSGGVVVCRSLKNANIS